MKKIILLGLFLILFPGLILAENTSMIKTQGIIMSLDLKKSILVVNEKTFIWNKQTTFYNEKGTPITIEKFKLNSWVYIEGENDQNKKIWIAKKIYQIPRFIWGKERHLYPFIEEN